MACPLLACFAGGISAAQEKMAGEARVHDSTSPNFLVAQRLHLSAGRHKQSTHTQLRIPPVTQASPLPKNTSICW